MKSVVEGKIQREAPTQERARIRFGKIYGITIRSDLEDAGEEELGAQTDHKTEHRAERRKTRKSEKEKQDEAGKETPENFLRRLADFAL